MLDFFVFLSKACLTIAASGCVVVACVAVLGSVLRMLDDFWS